MASGSPCSPATSSPSRSPAPGCARRSRTSGTSSGAIVDGATDLILQVDAENRVVRLNPAGERLLGTTAAEALGRSCADVLGCEVAGGHGAKDCPLAEVRASGDPIAYRETAVRGGTGSPVRVAGLLRRDALGRRPAAPGRRRSCATSAPRGPSRSCARGSWRPSATSCAPRWRSSAATPRPSCTSSSSRSSSASYVERIDEASGRLAALVDQVLDVTHLQADPLILERSTTTFASLVARLRGELDVAGGAERLVVTAPADLPPLDVDVGRVGQVLSNLVGNARKYAPDGSPIVIGAAVDGAWLAVTVDDEGVGVPEAERGLVTEPFHRAWNVRESRIPGTGLGLFICRRLVEAHGGRLDVLDRPDGRAGTRVRFTLPLAEPAVETEAAGG